jgi:hypothetical protein
MNEIKLLLSKEIGRLIDDIYKCNNETLREKILMDIILLTDAIMQDNDEAF